MPGSAVVDEHRQRDRAELDRRHDQQVQQRILHADEEHRVFDQILEIREADEASAASGSCIR